MGNPAEAFNEAFIRDLEWERVWNNEKGDAIQDNHRLTPRPLYKDDLIMQEWRQENDDV